LGFERFTNWVFSGPAGPKTVTFTAPGVNPTTWQFVLQAAGASAIAINAGSNQTAVAGTAVPIKPSVKVTDVDGNAVSGVAVVFTVTGGGGSITGASATTDANGIAQVGSWTLGVGANSLRAQAAGVGTPVTFTATGTP
jgi:adhesin/invasin